MVALHFFAYFYGLQMWIQSMDTKMRLKYVRQAGFFLAGCIKNTDFSMDFCAWYMFDTAAYMALIMEIRGQFGGRDLRLYTG